MMLSEANGAETSLASFTTWPVPRRDTTTTDTARLPWLQTWQQRSSKSSRIVSTNTKGQRKNQPTRPRIHSRYNTTNGMFNTSPLSANTITTTTNIIPSTSSIKYDASATKVAIQAANYLAMSPAYATLHLNEQSARLVEQTARDTATIRAIRQGDWSQLTNHDIANLIRGLTLSFPNGGCTYLTHIAHSGIYMSVEEIRMVAQLVRAPICNVRELTLRNVSLASNGARVLAKSLKYNTTLRRLDLAENTLTGSDMQRLCAKLEKASQLQYLDLARNPLGPQGIDALLMRSNQKSHYFGTFDGTSMAKRKHRALKVRHRGNTPILGFPLNLAMPLVQLNVRDTSLGPEGMKLLARLIAIKRTLRWVNAAGNNGGVLGAQAIAQVLADPTLKLARLSLELNDIGVQGGEAIAHALTTNVALTHLHLPRNNIKDQGVKAIANALRSNHTLRYLQLEFNGITHIGAQGLSDTLRENDVLRGLQLRFNFIGDSGCQSLAEALKVNTSLEHISLCNNQLTDACAGCLSGALARNRALQHISLTQNRGLGLEGHRQLAETLIKHNTTLKSIRVDYEFPEWVPIYEMIQSGVTRNFWQDRCRRKAAIELLVHSRIILSARPANNNNNSLLSHQSIATLPTEVKMTILGWTVRHLLEPAVIRRVFSLATAPFKHLHRRTATSRILSSDASCISVDPKDCGITTSGNSTVSAKAMKDGHFNGVTGSSSSDYTDKIYFLQECLGVLYKPDASHDVNTINGYTTLFGF
ncbi:hypothetical protein BDF22DRAFT_664612 [Syncephalis plumigaleata]|nr:hypothetical protein BDF22DRAFT_664612 [Syncephalis plumigaleata]